jgi:hypothetical protein
VLHLLLLLETKSYWITRSLGCLLFLLETKSSRTTRSLGFLHLLLKNKSSRTIGSLCCLLLLLKSQSSRTPRGKRPASHLAKDKELHDTTGKRPPPPLAQDLHLHHSTKQLELLLNTDRAPSTHQLVYVTPNDSLSSAFLFSGRKFRTSIRTLVEKGSKLLNHSERRLWWMNPARMM